MMAFESILNPSAVGSSFLVLMGMSGYAKHFELRGDKGMLFDNYRKNPLIPVNRFSG